MAITKQKKEKIVDLLTTKFKNTKSATFFDYTGINVKNTIALKRILRGVGGDFIASKKKLINIALLNNGIKDFFNLSYKGSCAVIFSDTDEVSAIKSLYSFVKGYLKKNKNASIKVIGGIFDGKVISKEEVDNLSNVLSKNEFISKFMFMLQYPASGLTRTLNAINEKKSVVSGQ